MQVGETLVLPNQPSPIRRYPTFTESGRYHPSVTIIGSQNMTAATESAEVSILVSPAPRQWDDVVAMALIKSNRNMAARTAFTVALPYPFTGVSPYFCRLSPTLTHRTLTLPELALPGRAKPNPAQPDRARPNPTL